MKTSTILLKVFVLALLSAFFLTQTKAQCTASFGYTTSLCTVSFTSTSTGTNNNTQYNWSFGDATTSTQQNPVHTYSISGKYDWVCLTIVNQSPFCWDSACVSITVNCNSTAIATLERSDISLTVNNPVVSSADIQYSIPSSGRLELALFDILGNKIRALESGNKSAGAYSSPFSSNGLLKGIYFIRLNFEGTVFTQKIIITG